MQYFIKPLFSLKKNRLPQVVSQSKKSLTLTNYLYKVLSHNVRFYLWQYEYINLIYDVTSIANTLNKSPLNFGSTINIANWLMISISKPVEILEIILKKTKYNWINIGSNFKVFAELLDGIVEKLRIYYINQYIQRIFF